jgi:O-antigen ligase
MGSTGSELRYHLDRLVSRRRTALAWIVLPVAAVIVRYQPRYLPHVDLRQLIAAVIGVGLVIVGAKRPDRAIAAFIILMPFQLFLQSWLFSRGLPLALLKNAGYWKEPLAVGVFAAGWRGYVRRGHHADALDILGLFFVAYVALFALFPALFSTIAPTDALIRYTAFREMAGYVLLFTACRHVEFKPGTAAHLGKILIAVAAVTSAIAVYEVIFSDTWNDFVVNNLEVPRWLFVTGQTLPNPTDIRIYAFLGGRQIVRAASVYVSLFFPLLLLLPIALLFGRFVRRNAGRMAWVAALILLALLLTQTRNEIGAAAVIIALSIWLPTRGRVASAAKTRVALALVAGFIVMAPFAVSSGLTGRIAAIVTNADQSSNEHQNSIDRGWGYVTEHPLGLGLGTTTGVGQRFGTTIIVADNQYLHVANEVGVVGMLLYTGFILLVIVRLRGSPEHPASLETSAVRIALIAISLAAWLHQPWIDLSITWPFWCIAGAALSEWEASKDRPVDESATSVTSVTAITGDSGSPWPL